MRLIDADELRQYVLNASSVEGTNTFDVKGVLYMINLMPTVEVWRDTRNDPPKAKGMYAARKVIPELGFDEWFVCEFVPDPDDRPYFGAWYFGPAMPRRSKFLPDYWRELREDEKVCE